jgi:hypothetical protein
MFNGESNRVNQQHMAASAETEARHPTRSREAPDHAGRTQLIALAVFLGVPFLLLLISSFRQ